MIRVLSLGAGVQSSTLLLMAARGELGDVPDAAIFADTGWEPARVYEWLDYLEDQVRGVIPIHRVSRGEDARGNGSIRESYYSGDDVQWHLVLRRPDTPAEMTPPWKRKEEA